MGVGDVASLAGALERTASDPAAAELMAKDAREYVMMGKTKSVKLNGFVPSVPPGLTASESPAFTSPSMREI